MAGRGTCLSKRLRKRTWLAIGIFICTGAVAGGILTPLLNNRWLFNISFWLSWFALAAASLSIMFIDPADPAVGMDSEPEIGKPWCDMCKASVRLDSKHCWECNKCIGHFDHHCPWLSSCIGVKNYRRFFISVCSLLVNLSTVLCAAVTILAQNVDALCLASSFQTWACLPKDVITGLLIAILAVYTPLWCLDFTLAMFHCYICYKGLTTYEYLRGSRKLVIPEETESDLERSREVSKDSTEIA